MALVATAGLALADPGIDRLETEVRKNRRLDIEVEATLGGRGEIRIEGNVNGRTVRFRKRVRKAGTKRARFKIDAKRFKLRKLDGPLTFDVTAIVEERDGASVEQVVQQTVAVPVVIVPGLGNELAPGGSDVFALALNLATGGAYTLDGKVPTLVVHDYTSLDSELTDLGKDLKSVARKSMRGSSFARIDAVGYSMGGLVIREWLAGKGRGKVRRAILVGTPNQGAPLAQVVSIALQTGQLGDAGGGLVPDLGDLGGLSDVLNLLGGEGEATEVLRVFHPTYPWAFITVPFLGRVGLTQQLLDQFGGLVPGLGDLPIDLSSPLTPLNAVGPDPDAEFFALGYTALLSDELGGAQIGTVDEIDLTPLLSGNTEDLDLTALADGDGDGLVPWRSVIMSDTPTWRTAITSTDLGAGNHFTLLADPAVIARIVQILGQ